MSIIRLAAASSLIVALSACSGSGLGGVLGGLNPISGAGPIQCDTGTQVQLASPQPGQTGVSGDIGQIIIVADGNNNALYNTYNQWNITLTDQFGEHVSGGNVSLVSYPSGPHPYPSDYYYASSIGRLTPGATWSVQLNEQNANCSPVPLNSFST